MAITLKEEAIREQWSTIVDHGAGHVQEVLSEIQEHIRESQIPGECTWSVEEVKSSTWVARVRREFLIVDLKEFKDYHLYIGVRDYGVHLDCCWFLTIEPGLLKKWASQRLTGDAEGLSGPANILIQQDLRAWLTVVHHAVLDSVNSLLTRLGQDPRLLQRKSKGMLEIW